MENKTLYIYDDRGDCVPYNLPVDLFGENATLQGITNDDPSRTKIFPALLTPEKNQALQTQILSGSSLYLTQEEIESLINMKVLVAGLGVGSVYAQEMAKLACATGKNGQMTLLDFDTVTQANLGRQAYDYDLVGKSKAFATAEMVQRRNPGVNILAHNKKATKDEIWEMVKQSNLVFWGLDTPSVIETLHTAAHHYKVPVISGLDLGRWAMGRHADYRDPNQEVLWGRVQSEPVKRLRDENQNLLYLVATMRDPKNDIPLSVWSDLMHISEGNKGHFSQPANSVAILATTAAIWSSKILSMPSQDFARFAPNEHIVNKETHDSLGGVVMNPKTREAAERFRDTLLARIGR